MSETNETTNSGGGWTFIPGFIRRDFLRKCLALFFATLIWNSISSRLGEERTLHNIPLKLRGAGDTELMDYMPKAVNVTLKGSARRLKLVSPSELVAEMTVTPTVSPGQAYTFTLPFSAIKTPYGVKVTEIAPNVITAHADVKTTRDVGVKAEFKGELKSGYAIGEVKLTPASVTVTGPESMVKSIESVSTAPILVDKSTVADFEIEQPLRSGDDRVLITPSIVTASVEIYQKQGARVFENIPIRALFGNGPKPLNVSFSVDSVNITLSGPKSALENVRRSHLRAFVDLTSLNEPGVFPIKVDSWLENPAPDVTVKFVIPSDIDVTVTARK